MEFEKEISISVKNKFAFFGAGSVITRPFLQLSGLDKIRIGNNTTILDNCRLSVYGDSHDTIINIGDGCYIGYGFSALASSLALLSIGDNVLIASNVLITNENHGIDPENEIYYMDQPLTAQKTSIGNGCWIGEKVCILPGVNIGEKSIIGAGSVVTKSIPSYSIAVGNPAKVIKKYNFDEHKWKDIE